MNHNFGIGRSAFCASNALSQHFEKSRRQMSPPQRYSFVNARPQTKAEKRQTRTAIRSHIGRWTQEKQQKLDSNVGSASDKDSPPELSRTVSLSPASTEQTRLRPRPRNRIGSIRSETVDDASDSPSILESTEGDVDDISERALISSTHLRWETSPGQSVKPNLLVQGFGSGILDPFRTYPSSNFPSSLVSQAHEYCE